MDGANAAVAAEDFKKLLSRHGLNLIAERVEDEKTVVQLLDYGVDYRPGLSVRRTACGARGCPARRPSESVTEPRPPVIPFRKAG